MDIQTYGANGIVFFFPFFSPSSTMDLEIHAQPEDLLFEPISPDNSKQDKAQTHTVHDPTPQTYTGHNHTVVAQVLLPGQGATTPYVYAEFYAKVEDPCLKYYFLGVRNAPTPPGRWWVEPAFMDQLIIDAVESFQNDFPLRYFKDTNVQIKFGEPQIGYHAKTDTLPCKYNHPLTEVEQGQAPDILTHSNGQHPYARMTIYLTPQPTERRITTKEEDDRLMANITRAVLFAKKRWLGGFPQQTFNKRPPTATTTTTTSQHQTSANISHQGEPFPTQPTPTVPQIDLRHQLQQQQHHPRQFHPYHQGDRRPRMRKLDWKQRVYF